MSASGYEIEIIGLPQLQQFFGITAPGDIQNGVNNGLEQIAKAIDDTTKGLVPVKTGALKNSIEVTTSGDTITAHAGENYASYVDEGSSRMSAEPFFQKPIEGVAEGLNEAIEGALERSGLFSD
jgi:hypothetical protein